MCPKFNFGIWKIETVFFCSLISFVDETCARAGKHRLHRLHLPSEDSLRVRSLGSRWSARSSIGLHRRAYPSSFLRRHSRAFGLGLFVFCQPCKMAVLSTASKAAERKAETWKSTSARPPSRLSSVTSRKCSQSWSGTRASSDSGGSESKGVAARERLRAVRLVRSRSIRSVLEAQQATCYMLHAHTRRQ